MIVELANERAADDDSLFMAEVERRQKRKGIPPRNVDGILGAWGSKLIRVESNDESKLEWVNQATKRTLRMDLLLKNKPVYGETLSGLSSNESASLNK